MSDQANDYSADSINILEGMEAVRKRPGMYIGDTFSRGLHHLVYETVDNSIDEAMAGYCTQVEVIINHDGSCTVEDDGRGIPVDIHKDAGKPALEVILTTLHAGGKFGGDNSYKVSGGLHGVGVSCVNALSSMLEAEVYRDGKIHQQRFSQGIPSGEMKVIGNTEKRGTKITFQPDETIFETVDFKYDILANRIRELAFLNKGVNIILRDERNDKEEVFNYEGGIVSFVEHLNQNKEALHPEVLYFEKEQDGVTVEVSMQYNTSYQENIFSFANNINTHEGGTHLAGFRSALTRTLNRYATSNNMGKKDELPSGDDYREGLTCIVSVKLPEPQFEGQTKTKLGNSEIQGMVEAIVNDRLGQICEEQPSVAKNIIKSAMQAAMARKAAKKARELTRRKNAMDVGNLPGKLADCSSKDRSNTEIFIVEGDSAGGSAKQGRDRNFQAILPIKGKILNVEKARIDKMLSHDEIKAMVIAMGTGIGEDEFDIEKRRYDKIIIMTDADHDGSHIRTLLMTFFFRHMRELVEKGHLYVAQPPLYKVSRGKKEEYIFDDQSLRQKLADLGLEGVKVIRGENTYEGSTLQNLLNILDRLNVHADYLLKKDVNLTDMLMRRADGKVPRYRASHQTSHEYLATEDDLKAHVKQLGDAVGQEMTIVDSGLEDTYSVGVTEILESKDIDRLLGKLEGEFGFEANDLITSDNFTFISKEEEQKVESLLTITGIVQEQGRKGLEVQRYKGLGEMNPDQLWETTMDPKDRVLLRVKMEDVVKADELFTLFMGQEVEPRKAYITKHALEVTNLDV